MAVYDSQNGCFMIYDRRGHVRPAPSQVERYPTAAGVIEALTAGDPRPGVPTVVIVAGLGAVGMMRRTMTSVSQWTHCVLLDVPGYHRKGPDACPPTVQDIAELVVVWLREHATTPVVLMGHSTGSQAVLHAAGKVPHLVHTLVLAGPTLVPAARRPWGLTRKLARTLIHESVFAGAAIVPDFARAGVSNLLRLTRSGMNDRPEEVVRQITCPILIVTGTQDHLAPQGWANELAALSANGIAVTLTAAHSFPYTMPQELSDLVQQAIRREPARTAPDIPA